jgi:hypothetical protein
MSDAVSILISQFVRSAERALTYRGKTYTLTMTPTMPILTDRPNNEAHFSYMARKARGAFMASKIRVSVRYDEGADLYDLTFRHSDGATLDVSDLAEMTGAYVEDFQRLNELLHILTRRAA